MPDLPDLPDDADLPDTTQSAESSPPPEPTVLADGPEAGEPPTPAPGGARRAPLVAAAVAVVVVLALIAVVLGRRSEPVAAPATVAPITSTESIAPGTEAGTLPPETEPPTTFAAETFPEQVTAPPNTHTLPPAPYVVITPKNPGKLAIYPSDTAKTPDRFLDSPRLINNDPNAAVPLTLLLKAGAFNGFLEVFLPVRPNGSTGFVKVNEVNQNPHNFHIEVRLSQFNLKVFNGSNVILDVPIAVAGNNTPTPGGLYYTTELLKPPNGNGPYGTYAYGLSGFSDVYKTFNGGPGQLGIHGTNTPSSIGKAVSNGCIRMRNEDIEKLAPVLPLGVPVQIFK